MQRTLNRELKELEVVGREAIASSGEGLPGRGHYVRMGTQWRPRIYLWSHSASIRQSSRYQLEGYDAPSGADAADPVVIPGHRKASEPGEQGNVVLLTEVIRCALCRK